MSLLFAALSVYLSLDSQTVLIMSATIKGTRFESEEEKIRKKGREGERGAERRERLFSLYTSARQKHGSMLVQHQLFHKKCIKLVKLLLKNG